MSSYPIMCGRFDQIYQIEQLAARFAAVYGDLVWQARYNIAPSQDVPIIINQGKNEIRLFKWGLVPSWAKDPVIGPKMINARAETISQKPIFKNLIKTQRCLVPATGFYEWRQEKGSRSKTPIRVTFEDGRIFALAGLWSCWQSPQGAPLCTFTIITTDASEDLKPIHERMPVILPQEHELLWLDLRQGSDALLKLLRPYSSSEMKMYEVSSDVNSPKNDGPELIRPVKES